MEKSGPVDFLLVYKIKNDNSKKKFYDTRDYLRPFNVGGRSITQRKPI